MDPVRSPSPMKRSQLPDPTSTVSVGRLEENVKQAGLRMTDWREVLAFEKDWRCLGLPRSS